MTPEEVRRAHREPLSAIGTVNVEHGSHWIVRPLVALMALPAAAPAQRVRLDVTADGGEMVWVRHIGARVIRTRQRVTAQSIVERNGLGTIVFDVGADDGVLVYRQRSCAVAGIPLPRALAPHVEARAAAADNGWDVDVQVTWRGNLVCRYSGRMALA